MRGKKALSCDAVEGQIQSGAISCHSLLSASPRGSRDNAAGVGTMAGASVPCQHGALSDPARKEGAGQAPVASRYVPALSTAFISIQFGSQGPWDTRVRQLLLCWTSIFLPLLPFKQSRYHCPHLTAGGGGGEAHAAGPSAHHLRAVTASSVEQEAAEATRLHSWSTFGRVCGFFRMIKKEENFSSLANTGWTTDPWSTWICGGEKEVRNRESPATKRGMKRSGWGHLEDPVQRKI